MSEESTPKQKEPEPGSGIVLRAHVYDGIQEYDQKLPNWWLFSWYITIVFFIIYWLAWFQFDALKSDTERMDEALAVIHEKQAEAMAALLDDGSLWDMSENEAAVTQGRDTFMATCMACHGPNLGGKTEGPQYIGESLKDNLWKYGGNPTDVYKIVHDGSPDVTKGMPPWGGILGAEKVAQVVAFVMSHHDRDAEWEPSPDAPAGGAAAPAPATAPSPAPAPAQ